MNVEQPDDRTLELREEELVVRGEMQDVGTAHIRTRVEEVPARLEVEAKAEEVEVEHVPVGKRLRPIVNRPDLEATQPLEDTAHHDTLAGTGMDQDPLR